MVFGSRKGLLGFVWRRQRRLERNFRGRGKRRRRRVLSHRAGRQPLLRTRNRPALPPSLPRHPSPLTSHCSGGSSAPFFFFRSGGFTSPSFFSSRTIHSPCHLLTDDFS